MYFIVHLDMQITQIKIIVTMKTRASLIVMSHLSDVQTGLEWEVQDKQREILNFVKYIILNLKGDLNCEIDPDDLWNEFLRTSKKM